MYRINACVKNKEDTTDRPIIEDKHTNANGITGLLYGGELAGMVRALNLEPPRKESPPNVGAGPPFARSPPSIRSDFRDIDLWGGAARDCDLPRGTDGEIIN